MRAGIVAGAGLLLLVPAGVWASGELTATSVRVADHPGFVRVVVDLRGPGTLQLGEVELRDPAALPRSGSARVLLRNTRARTRAASVAAHGVRVRVARRGGQLRVSLAAGARRFKAVQERVFHNPERLVLDLWKAAPPTAGATVRDDGCLTLDAFTAGAGRVRARGRALQQLFESSLVVQVRGARGRIVGIRPVTTVAGRWRRSVPYSVRRPGRGTLEAAVFSAKDGSLECLVQVPVRLR